VHHFAQLPAPIGNPVLETRELLRALGEVLPNYLEKLVVLGVICAKTGLYFGHVELLVERGGLVHRELHVLDGYGGWDGLDERCQVSKWVG
jgi:hypothetical protein